MMLFSGSRSGQLDLFMSPEEIDYGGYKNIAVRKKYADINSILKSSKILVSQGVKICRYLII